MYGPNDPIGGYVVTGGPAGTYAQTASSRFAKVDMSNGELPATIDAATTRFPAITKTEAQLLAEGPQ